MSGWRRFYSWILVIGCGGWLAAVSGCSEDSEPKSEPRTIATAAMLNAPEYSIGVPQGAAAMTVVERDFPQAEILYFQSLADGYAAVEYGKIDAFAFDRHAMKYVVSQNPQLALLPESIAEQQIVIGIRPGGEALAKRINAFIAGYRADGTYQDMFQRWFEGADLTMPELPQPTHPELKLKVGTEGLNVPQNFLDADGELSGFDVEFTRRLARFLNADVELSAMTYPALIAATETGKIDLMIANLNGTPERRETMLLSDSYVDSDVAFLIRRDRAPQEALAARLTDFHGATIASMTGNACPKFIDAVLNGVNHAPFNDYPSMVEALRSGKIDAIATDEPVAQMLAGQCPELMVLPELVAQDRYGLAMRLDDPRLPAVNAVIERFQQDGTIAKIGAYWFGDTAAKELPRLDYKPDFDGSAGVLLLGHDIETPPMSYLAGDRPQGFDLELVTRLAYELNLELKPVPMNFSSLIAALKAGKVDLITGCISITEERKKSVAFSLPYYEGGIALVIRKPQAAPDAASAPGFGTQLLDSFRRTFLVENRYKLVLSGLWVTVLISVLSAIFGTVLGFGVCLLRRSQRWWLNWPARSFIRGLQGMPVVVLLMILYYIVFGSIDIDAVVVAVIGFSLNFAAYVSEMMRTGIAAVDPGQLEAAEAMGFGRCRIFGRIIFPQAARYVLPVYKGEFISMVKMTSIVGYIAIQDLTKMSDIIRSRTYEAFFPLIATALLYFLISYGLTLLLSLLEWRIDPKHRKRAIRGVVTR